MLKFTKRFLICLPLILLLGSTCFAQFNSNVQGTVTDQAGAVIPGASVALRNLENGVTYNATSNEAGIYRFLSVGPGRYSLKVSANGFAAREMAANVTTNQTAGVDVQLAIAGKTEEVTVTSEVTGVNTEETRIQNTLSTREVAELPIWNRSLISLASVTPGVTTFRTEDSERRDSFEPGRPEIHANGLSSRSNQYVVDGLPVMSAQDRGNINLMPSPDMVQEVAFQATSFSVENGATASMQAEFTTKSGANKFHGDVDYTYASKGFTATPLFAAKGQPYKKNYLSGAFGGPIIKDKTFFFGSVQQKNWNMPPGGGLEQDFSKELADWALANLPSDQVSNGLQFFKVAPSRLTNVRPFATAATFFGTQCGDGPEGAPFGHIPCDLVTQVEGISVQNPTERGIQYNLRLDQYMNGGKDRVYLQFFRMDQHMDALASDRPAADGQSYLITSYANVNYTHQFTQTLLNQASFGFTRSWNGMSNNAPYFPFGGGSSVWRGGWDQTCYDSATGTMTRLCTGGNWFGLWGYAASYAGAVGTEHGYTFRDYLTWIKGKHSIKAGVQFYRPDYLQFHGEYAKAAVPDLGDLWDFITGHPHSVSFWNIDAHTGGYQPQIYGAAVKRLGFHFEDQWKVTPSLLLSLGVRFDDFGNPYPSGKGALPFVSVNPGDGGTFQERIFDVYTKMVPNAFEHSQKGFMPRFGFAWSPGGSGKTSIRGGWGLYMDTVTPAEVSVNLPTQPPNRISANLNSDATTTLWDVWGVPGAPAPTFGFRYPQITPNISPRGGVVGAQAEINGIDTKLATYKTMIWNFGLEHELPARLVLGLAYSGSHAYDQPFAYQYNTVHQAVGMLDPTNPQYVAGDMSTPAWLTTEFGKINYTRNGLEANYHSLIASVRQNYKNFQWQANYTWAHALDDNAGGNTLTGYSTQVIDGYHPHDYYSSSDFDMRHRFALSGIYTLPKFTNNAAGGAIVNGWQLSSVINASTGAPYSVYAQTDLNFDRTADGGYDFPNYLGGYKEGFTKRGGLVYGGLTSDMFVNPTAGEGNSPRNAFRQPGYFSVDGGVTKKFTMPWIADQKSTLALRIEAINLFNRANLSVVQNNLSKPHFGEITRALNARILQFGVRFEF